MKPVQKEAIWAHIEAGETANLTPGEARDLAAILSSPLFKRAAGTVFQRMASLGKEALGLRIDDSEVLTKLARLQGAAAGMMQFINGLLDLTDGEKGDGN